MLLFDVVSEFRIVSFNNVHQAPPHPVAPPRGAPPPSNWRTNQALHGLQLFVSEGLEPHGL
jgi:hypothetical protein